MMGTAPPLLVVTPTKRHVGWDVPVSVARRAGLLTVAGALWHPAPKRADGRSLGMDTDEKRRS